MHYYVMAKSPLISQYMVLKHFTRLKKGAESDSNYAPRRSKWLRAKTLRGNVSNVHKQHTHNSKNTLSTAGYCLKMSKNVSKNKTRSLKK